MLARSKNEEPKRISPAERTYRFSSSIRLEAAKIGSLARVVLPLLLRPNITVKGRRLSRVYALNARYPSHSTTCSATMSPLVSPGNDCVVLHLVTRYRSILSVCHDGGRPRAATITLRYDRPAQHGAACMPIRRPGVRGCQPDCQRRRDRQDLCAP